MRNDINTLSEIKAVMYDPEKGLHEVFGLKDADEYNSALERMCNTLDTMLQQTAIRQIKDTELAVDVLENVIGIRSYTGKQLLQFTLMLQALLAPIAAANMQAIAHMKECAVR